MPAKLYSAIGGAAGCHGLAVAFYANVARDPVLRPLFPSTFTCAIEEFSAFLVQFLGGESEAMQRRWWLSLRESHDRFSIGQRERTAWLHAMTATLSDNSVVADARVRAELLGFFVPASAYVVNKKDEPVEGELSDLWREQLALDEAVAELHHSANGARCIELLESPALRNRFSRCPSVHASVIALTAISKIPVLRDYAAAQLRTNPSLIHERYKGGRTLLHDAAGAGEIELVERLLDLGAGNAGEADKALYCVANECATPGGAGVVRLLLQKGIASVNAVHGVKRCTALHMAARRGNVDLIAALLDGGANIEVRDSAGETPLRRAVNCNQLEAAKLLLARGANADSKGSRALTPAGAARSAQMKQLFTGITS